MGKDMTEEKEQAIWTFGGRASQQTEWQMQRLSCGNVSAVSKKQQGNSVQLQCGWSRENKSKNDRR